MPLLEVAILLFAAATPAPDGSQGDAGVPPDIQEIEKALQKDTAAQAPDKKSAPGPSPFPSSFSPYGTPGASAPLSVGALFQTLNPDLSFILDVAAAYFSEEDPMETGEHDPKRNGFNLQQLEMAIGKSVDPYFRFDSNIVFGQDTVEIEEAYATTLDLPAGLQIRAGQFLTRFGRINSTHPHAWDFVDQPFIIGRYFGGDGNHGLGGELSWLTPLPWYVEVVGSITDANGATTARSFYGDTDPWLKSPLDFQFTGAVKQFFPLHDDLSLLFGLSSATGPNQDNRQTLILGTDIYLKYRPVSSNSFTIVSLQAEGMWRRRWLTGEILTDTGGYAQLFYRFAQRWALAFRFENGSPALAQNGSVGYDPLNPEWTEARQRWSLNATFWPTEFSRIRLQGSADVPHWQDQAVYAVFLAFEVVVGAHGAHKF